MVVSRCLRCLPPSLLFISKAFNASGGRDAWADDWSNTKRACFPGVPPALTICTWIDDDPCILDDFAFRVSNDNAAVDRVDEIRDMNEPPAPFFAKWLLPLAQPGHDSIQMAYLELWFDSPKLGSFEMDHPSLKLGHSRHPS